MEVSPASPRCRVNKHTGPPPVKFEVQINSEPIF